MELRRKMQEKHAWRKGVRKGSGMLGRESCAGSSVLRGFKGGDSRRGPREDLNRIFIKFPSVSFQGHGLR